MKKGKLTAIESSCIKGMISDDVSTADMATQLNRGLATIEKEVNVLSQMLLENNYL